MSQFNKVVESAQNNNSLRLNHTCIRVKDPKASVKFYQESFGMKLVSQKDFPEMKFSLYFLSFPNKDLENTNPFSVNGILELTHNWGTETDPDFKVNNGNVEPNRGFGHIAFTTNDIDEACQELELKKVNFKKRLVDGRQKDIAFVLDPDQYWIEIVGYKDVNVKGYQFNHTMMRIKDPSLTLPFYQNVLGMKLFLKDDHPNADFTNYFMGYQREYNDRKSIEGVIELCHNWGTENDPNFKYHNGNDNPQGYGHICVSLNDPETLCNEIESKYGDEIEWAPKWNQGKMKQIAFLKDPDGYSIEVVPEDIVL